MATSPTDILDAAFRRASSNLSTPTISDLNIAQRVSFVAKSRIGAGIRLVLACTLAKAHNPSLDIRKPHAAIGGGDAYSGRDYDETYITPFINTHKLPCNSTTAFLTPALRTKNLLLTADIRLEGRDPSLYKAALQLLEDVHTYQITAEELLAEAIRALLVIRDENRRVIEDQLSALRANQRNDILPLSADAIVTLIKQHMTSPNASRLPVLVIAAAYNAASQQLGERILTLQSHNAADEQTGALGDVEITLINDKQVVTSYEMKMKRVTIEDVDRALQKLARKMGRIDQYIFITTDVIEEQVQNYVAGLYAKTGGTEVVVLDCIGFLRHFLHLFHRLRVQFLEAYQSLVLIEPESAVRQELKETFLTLRRAAETGQAEVE